MDDWLGRRPWPGRRCEHLYPTLLVDVEAGGYYARCLGCLEVVPERFSPEAARAALAMLGSRTQDQAAGG